MKKGNKTVKRSQRNNILLFSLGVLLLLIVGGIIMQLIFERISDLNRKVLRDIANEKALSVQKEFDLLSQRIDFLLIQGKGKDRTAIEEFLLNDLLLHSCLTIAPADSVQKSGDWRSSLIYPLDQVVDARQGKLRMAINLRKLNEYFWTGNSGHAYFEIVSRDGFYLLHPDILKVGKANPIAMQLTAGAKDSIVMSNYLGVDILRRNIALGSLFGGAELAACAPLLITSDETQEVLNLSMLLGIGFLVITITFLQIIYRNRQRVQQLEIDQSEISREQAMMRFERLREQMNPHFLFNALGSLQQLIAKDQAHAKIFVGKMAKVYRKILQDDRSGWSTVEEEISVAQAYFFMQEVRFGGALTPIRLDIPSPVLRRHIPRLSLQILLENAIKHNIFTNEEPMEMTFSVQADTLLVANRYRPRTVPESQKGGYGLAYISAIYRHFEMEGFEHYIDDTYFVVRLPLR